MNDNNPDDQEIEAAISSVDPLVCQTTGFLGKPVSVIVDRAAGMIHFQNCHSLKGFWTIKAQPQFSCRLADLQGVRRLRMHGRARDMNWLSIVTPAGNVDLGEEATNYELLCELLPDLIPPSQRTVEPNSQEVVGARIPRRKNVVDFSSRLANFSLKFSAAILVFVFILYLAYSVTMSGIGELLKASRSKSWPTVPGTVTESRVDRQTDSKGRIAEFPVVRYQYEVDGKPYRRGDLSRSGTVTTSWFESAQSVTARYVVGQPVKVYYDRQHPESAVLEPGTTAGMWAMLWPAALFWFVIGACAIAFRQGMAEPSTPPPKTISEPRELMND